MNELTPYQAKYIAYDLTRRFPSGSSEKFNVALMDAQVDLNPHQVESALFAFKSPLSKGAILADEVGLGKTIEAGILLSQLWAERRKKLLIICPANLRKQWSQELDDKFFLDSIILENKNFNEFVKSGKRNPFDQNKIIICSYQFARAKADLMQLISWDLAVVDEAHRLRNVYKPTNKIGNAIKEALSHSRKALLDAIQLRAPKNGYVFVFVSNESNVPVYFDNLQVTHDHQHILEENHYYAYGLRIAAISSRKISDNREGCVTNNYLYQGDYSEMDEDLGWNDFDLRNYDPQIGRWIQQDPYDQFSSPYVGMGNNPVNNVDPSGGSILSSITGATTLINIVGGAIIGGIIGAVVDSKSGGKGGFVKGAAIGAGVALIGSVNNPLLTFVLNLFNSKLNTPGNSNYISVPRINIDNLNEQNGRQNHGDPCEDEFRQFVCEGRYEDAIKFILKNYSWAMYADAPSHDWNVKSIGTRHITHQYTPNKPVNKKPGQRNSSSQTTYSSDLLNLIKFPAKFSYGFQVRAIFHERVHMIQSDPDHAGEYIDFPDAGYMREIDAYYEMLFNNSLPAMNFNLEGDQDFIDYWIEGVKRDLRNIRQERRGKYENKAKAIIDYLKKFKK